MVVVIAEIGVNHNGCMINVYRLIDMAKRCGADYVKFQTYNTELLVHKDTRAAKYQNVDSSQYDMLLKYELKKEDYENIVKYCKAIDIGFMSTPFDIPSVDLLEELGVDIYKISSGDLTNYPLLRYVASKNKLMLISTGMSSEEEICDMLDFLNGSKIVLLHCTSCYPTNIRDINLSCLKTLSKYGPIGYSDHTSIVELGMMAVALGVEYIEKHITLNNNMEGPDHKASMNEPDFKLYVENIRTAELIMGSPEKRCLECESDVKNVARRMLAFSRNIPKRTVLAASDLIGLRASDGIDASIMSYFIGKKLKNDVKKHELLTADMF